MSTYAKRKEEAKKVKEKEFEQLRKKSHITSLDDLQEGRGIDDDGSDTNGQKLIRLAPNRFYVNAQVRTILTEEEIEERCASMKAEGQLTPIKVFPADQDGNYRILHGECRWRAAQRISGFKLDAVIDPRAHSYSDVDIICSQLGENSTIPLHVQDEARSVYQLVHEHNLPISDVAKRLGHVNKNGDPKRGRIYRLIAFHELPEDGKALYSDELNDLVIFQELSKINKLSPETYRRLVEVIHTDGQITRRRVVSERELLEGKKKTSNAEDSLVPATPRTNDSGEGSKPSSNLERTSGTQKRGSSSRKGNVAPETTDDSVTAIMIRWKDRSGQLILSRRPSEPDRSWVSFDDDSIEEVPVSEMSITSIS